MKCCNNNVLAEVQESHPARGAWIEISLAVPARIFFVVAPRKGCVD